MKQDKLIDEIKDISNKLTLKFGQLALIERELVEIDTILTKTNNIQEFQIKHLVKGFEIDNVIYLQNLAKFKINYTITTIELLELQDKVKNLVKLQFEICELSEKFDKLLEQISKLEVYNLKETL